MGESEIEGAARGRRSHVARGGPPDRPTRPAHLCLTAAREPAGQRFRLLSDEQVEAVHEASLGLLEEIGIEFMGVARAMSSVLPAPSSTTPAASCESRARLSRPPSRPLRRSSPLPAQPERTLELGGTTSLSGSSQVRRLCRTASAVAAPGNLDDYITLVKLAQCFDVIHFVGNQPTSRQELPVARATSTPTSRTSPTRIGPSTALRSGESGRSTGSR